MSARPRNGRGSAQRASPSALPTILLVDADADQRAMLRDALLEGGRPFDLRAAASPAELERDLAGGRDPDVRAPSLVLIGLDADGREMLDAIERFKRDPELRRIPVVVLIGAGRRREDTVGRAYDAGANTVLPRPATFLALVRLMKIFTSYWLEAAALPLREQEPA
jgi:CheY-like chemotaxis protein